ncbi:hypothetical protein GCM10022419_062740 [Nonomuraea rosea]|uniref:Uncharacterized protein n=1 Tax=Nonomuraea rosea TaxID=638574 RepID=A0ABP6XVX1_9ACTN
MPEPLEYGGVDPESWPDCAALLAAVPGKRDPGRPDAKRIVDDGLFSGATLVPFSCYARIDDAESVEVVVMWMTKRPEDADVLLDGRPGTPPDADEYAGGNLRVGGVIVQVQGSDEAERAVVKRLRSRVAS